MPEIGTSGSMSGDGKRSVAEWPKLPRPSSTLPERHRLICIIGHQLQSFDMAQWTVILGFFHHTILGDRNGPLSKKGAKPPNPDSSA